MKARIYLAGGAVIETSVTEISVRKNALGERIGMKWTTAEHAAEQLLHLDLAQVAAVTTENESGDDRP